MFNGYAAFFARLFPSRVQTREALRWWHQRQVDRLHEGAELVRDNILQDLFAIRRTLELSHDEHAPTSASDLRQLEALHHKLERLSNTLSPAFIQDSFPLALQHHLKQWQGKHPDIPVSVKLPSTRQPSDSSSRVALITFEELLDLVAQHLSSEASLEIELTSQQQTMLLTVRVMEPEPQKRQAIANLQTLAHLHRSFQFLTEGNSKQSVRGSWIEWQFRWSANQQAQNE